ncbi:rhamnose/proton symporter RhaT [Thalassotalea sp. HSM 43]|nr:rhamnose/proton symporter RhaT [Thalassotalea sp. HSM 43]
MLPLLLVLLASVFQGTFGLGMKYTKPLAWEAWWLIHVTIAMIVFPGIWAVMVVPDLVTVITNSPAQAIQEGALYGFLWGIGGIMFGVCVTYIGVALTMGIVMGLAALMGSLIPLVQIDNFSANPAIPFIIAGMVIMLVAVAIVAKAGINRDKVLAESGQEIAGIATGSAFKKGLSIAIACGILSSLLNVGFSATEAIGSSAEEAGALTRNTALARWVVVLLGAYAMNAGYALFLLFKNNSWSSFSTQNAAKAYKWAIIAGLLWFAALGVYGQGAALMGDIGPVIGWPMLLGLALIISTVIGIYTGEWQGAPGPFKTMVTGIVVLISAICLLGYSNSIEQQPVNTVDIYQPEINADLYNE